MRKLGSFLLIVFIAMVSIALYLASRPSVQPFAEHFPLMNYIPADRAEMRIKFLGTSTLLIDDGEQQWMTDAYFSYPNLFTTAFGKIEPNKERIMAALKEHGIRSLTAIIPLHSHYDHLMDAAAVARKTSATIMGSHSSIMAARGEGIGYNRLNEVQAGMKTGFGKFNIEFIASEHLCANILGKELHWYEGKIEEPITMPCKASDFKVGETYALFVTHPAKNFLIMGSAGFVPGMLRGRKADIVFLGIGGLSLQTAAYAKQYIAETVEAVGATRVIPIHWNDLSVPIDGAPKAMRRFMGDLSKDMALLEELSRASNWSIEWMMPGDEVYF